MTAADLVIRELADSEAALSDRVRELEQDTSILREMVSESLRQIVHLTAHLDRARRTIVGLRIAERNTVPFAPTLHPPFSHPQQRAGLTLATQ